MKIRFDKKTKGQAIPVRFDSDVDETIRSIAVKEGASIVSTVRILVNLGLEMYKRGTK